LKIVVLKGGVSSERDVSLVSGDCISRALINLRHEVICLDTVLPWEQTERKFDPSEEFIGKGEANLVKLLNHPEMHSVDFVFNALHGGSGENGVVQGILHSLGFKFNGSDVGGCAIAMDKVVSKALFEKYQLPTAEWLHFNHVDSVSREEIIEEILDKFGLPVVIKPSHEGSTVGVSIINSEEELKPAIERSLCYDTELVVEKYIKGREITVSVLGDLALPVIEIIPKHGIYDYECKYTKGMSQYCVPAEIGTELTQRIQELSVLAFKALKCYGYGRLDIRLGDDGVPYFLELNALPGMTANSLVPKAAKVAGMSFGELLERIIEFGVKR